VFVRKKLKKGLLLHAFNVIFPSVLPCPDPPPNEKEAGWKWYGLEATRYKCPNGLKFVDGSYPYFHSNCTVAKEWEPPEVIDCERKFFFTSD